MSETDQNVPVIELDPDDQGKATVQENGMLYVGREHAGEEMFWWIESDG